MRNLSIVFLLFSISLLAQQPNKPPASELYHNLRQLNFLGSALYIAAHPDDENTRLISYLANDVMARTAYLSITRGDGGQNLIGPEMSELLGVIRTQELLAARRIDGGHQFFTRANDFGYSKHPDETLEFWNREAVLGDVVLAIRRFKPDIIINRFDHRSAGSTHGHHTASALMGMEAFDLAGNASQYPESANSFGTWEPKRLFFNTSWWFYGSEENFRKADKTNLLEVETGNYYPSLGLSNGEIASLSRSMHKSQGFGSSGSRGSQTEYLEFLKGDFPIDKSNLFDGINTSWSRVKGGAMIGAILEPMEKNFNFKDPSAMLPPLLQAYELIKEIEDAHWREIKLQQITQLIIDCGGIYLEAVSETNTINPGGSYKVTVEAVNRSSFPVVIQQIATPQGSVLISPNESLLPNERKTYEVVLTSEEKNTSTPYWLNDKGSLGMYKAPVALTGLPDTPVSEKVEITLGMGRAMLPISRNIVYKFTDPVKGEVYRPLEVLPEVTARIPDKVLVFSENNEREVQVIVRAGRDNINGSVSLQHPPGWTVSPAQHTYHLLTKGEEHTARFMVRPPKEQSEGYLRPLVQLGDTFFNKELVTLDYDHIPYQHVLLPSEAKVVHIDIEKKGALIGYIDGAGDAIPESLRQIGYKVLTIQPSEITAPYLAQFDAIVIGIRAYNTLPELAFKQEVLHAYVFNGGNIIVQYNTNRGLVTPDLAPYPLTLSRERVTDEDSPVRLLAPEHPALSSPNKITAADFTGWIQERGLYFPDNWDAAFTPLLGMKDPGESESKGSLLVASYGKGYFTYTGLSFFRELPAGVPGAYRLFANLLSLGKD